MACQISDIRHLSRSRGSRLPSMLSARTRRHMTRRVNNWFGPTSDVKMRGDIQGLRAVAVSLIVLGHLFGWPAGGFIGIDVFFVVSGFVITGLLIQEYDRNGRISMPKFYRRRIRRIVPTATLVILVTVLTSWLVFVSSRFTDVVKDAVSAFFFVSNWRFAATGTDPVVEASSSPFQHFWALSVLEQFYLLWPWALIGLLLTLGSKLGARKPVGILAATVLVTSAGWAAIQSSTTTAYFSSFTRVWELALGALLATALPLFVRLNRAAQSVLLFSGLALLIVAMTAITPSATFPWPWALVPTIGAALIIVSGVGSPAPGSFILDNGPMRYLGDMSYSLYLWHLPIIILSEALVPDQGRITQLIVLVLVLVFSASTYHAIERPLRYSPLLEPRERGAWSSWRRTYADSIKLSAGLCAVALVVPFIVFQLNR